MSRNRKNIRLKGFDYSSNGSYYVTICTLGKRHFFGVVEGKHVVLNAVGIIADKY